MAAIVAIVLVMGLFLGPLVLRLVLDRRADRANGVAAEIRATVRRRLGGDSLVSVTVTPGGLLTPGRVVLSAPRGYEGLIESVWPSVARRVPAGHELVVRTHGPSAPAAPAPRLPRAA
jgi:hypothetical protein